MDARRLRAGEWIVGLAGAVLAASLFMPWYGYGVVYCVRAPCPQPPADSGWESFAVIDLLLIALALAAVALVVVTARSRSASVPIAYEALLTIAAFVAVVCALLRVASIPGDAVTREPGLWVGLAATVAMLAGSMLAMRDERLSDADHPTDATGAPIAAPREVETLPAPPPAPSA